MNAFMKKIALSLAAVMASGMLLPIVSASATEGATVIDPSPYLATTTAGTLDVAGTLTVSVEGGRSIRVRIEKETLDGPILYYNTLLEEDGIYNFTLDKCEYNIETGDYDSSFTITVLDDGDTGCAYTLTDQLVLDPGFSLDASSTQYDWNIVSVATDTRQVTAVATAPAMVEDVWYSASDVTLAYIPYLLGDPNDDGVVDADDAYNVLVYYATQSVYGECFFTDGSSVLAENAAFSAADTNKDGAITADDAYEILLYYAQMAVSGEATWEHIYG